MRTKKDRILRYSLLHKPGLWTPYKTKILPLVFLAMFVNPLFTVALVRLEGELPQALLGWTVAVINMALIGLIAWRLAVLRKEYLNKGHKLCLGPDSIWLLDDRGGEETLWSLPMQRELRFSPNFSEQAGRKQPDHYLILADEHGERRIDFLFFESTRSVKRRIREWQARGANIRYDAN
jgi:hypothetical protein